MDDQARRIPRKNDHTMVESFAQRWGNHSSFKSGGMDRSGFPTFTVNHFGGPVTYSAESFLERNLDALNLDFVLLLRGTNATPDAPPADGSGSTNTFVRGLYSAKAIATQAHPRNEETIIAAQQPVKPMRAPSTRRKGTLKRMPTVNEHGEVDEKEKEDEEPLGTAVAANGPPCVGGEFRAALYTLFETLEETQSWYVFCINPNDSQLPNQLEGRSVKGQVRSIGLAEIARRNINVFEANMTQDEFVDRYKAQFTSLNIAEGDTREQIEQARTALGLEEKDVVLGTNKVFLSQAAFHAFEDDLRSKDTEEQKRNRLRDAEAEAGLDPRGIGDPYAPYQTPGAESPYEGGYNDPFGQSNQALPLYHDFRAWTNDPRPDWYFESMVQMRWNNRVGWIGYTMKDLSSMASSGKSVGVYDGIIYDLSKYISNGPSTAPLVNEILPTDIDTHFMDQSIVSVFEYNSGQDVTKKIDSLPLDSKVLGWQKTCLRNLFAVGMVDTRDSPKCQFATYILLSLSIMMVSVIGFKFIASINFGSARAPEDHDKFVICQVPCYTEGQSSLKKTIDSLAQMKYDDKRKLLLIVCDGMVVGSGNDQPTPRIVLDVLGASPNIDAEPLSFLSLGEGVKQHNMGKVYSGLYETAGHVVPYLVVVKCGKPGEKQRPGNRGKRDTQMLIMRFLNKVWLSS
ncbi:predicted protein [Postia placenta Mad-698-R]|nr:predicted protein [Postia placenta Mad-698-R]